MNTSWNKIEEKILQGDLNFSPLEINEIKSMGSKGRFYEFSSILYKIFNDDKIKYTEKQWENLSQFIIKLNNSLYFSWYTRTSYYNCYKIFGRDITVKPIGTGAPERSLKAIIKLIKDKKEINKIKTYIVNWLSTQDISIIYSLVDYLSPNLFKDRNDFIAHTYRIAHQSANYLDAAMKLNPYADDKALKELESKIETVLLHRSLNLNNKRVIFRALQENWFASKLKESQNNKIIDRIKLLMLKSEFKELENNDFIIVKRVSDLYNYYEPDNNSELILTIQEHYLNKIYRRNIGHLVTNKKKMLKFLTLIPGASPKKALYQLSKLNKNKDIEFLVKKFPSLSRLTALT
jgi:hypothetical protein